MLSVTQKTCKNHPLTYIPAALLPIVSHGQGAFFFGPPAIGFGVGLVSVHRRFPVATSIVSRRSSRQYTHTTFVRVRDGVRVMA